jgi:O-antigen/teichoic acid export membrane protein
MAGVMSVGKFVSSSALLTLDHLAVATGTWFYWIIVAKLTTITEVGQATTLYSLVVLVATISQLGLQYPILSKAYGRGSVIVWPAFIIQLIIILLTIPIYISALENFYGGSLERFTLIAIGIMASLSLSFVFRFSLLGISHVREVLIFDIFAVTTKFIVGYILVSMGYGAFGVLLSFLIQDIISASSFLVLAAKFFGFPVIPKMKYFKEILREGLVNTPFVLSRVIIYSLTIVLLAWFGITSSQIGVFYITLMMSMVVAETLSNMAYMVIPASAISKTDLSSHSTRISITVAAPILVALLASPSALLSIIGTEYIEGATVLMVLSIGTFPLVIVTNIMSKFNYLGELKKLLLVGSIRILTLIVVFIFLVPQHGILGAALSILLSNIASSLLAILWSRDLIRYIINSGISIASGWAFGYLLGVLSNGTIGSVAAILISVITTSVCIIALKNTSVDEIIRLFKILLRGPHSNR